MSTVTVQYRPLDPKHARFTVDGVALREGMTLGQAIIDHEDSLLGTKRWPLEAVATCDICGAAVAITISIDEHGAEECLADLDCACYYQAQLRSPIATDDEDADADLYEEVPV